MHNFLHHDHHTSQHNSTQEHFQKTAHLAIQKANKILHQKAVCRERNYTAHMHKQKAAFVRLGRSLGIFSLKCKSTLQRCPKKVTIITSISSIFRHVHVLNSCTQFMFVQSQFLLAAHKPDVAERGTKHKHAMHNFLHHDHHTSKHNSTQEHFQKKARMAIQKANKLLYSTAISRKLCVRERNYAAHMHKQNVAFVRLGRSLGIFSLKCKSTLQRCPKKVTIIISSIFTHVHASYMHLDAFSGNIRMS